MIEKGSDWYKNIWSLDIKNHSWVEDTKQQIDFIIKTLDLRKINESLIWPVVLEGIVWNCQEEDSGCRSRYYQRLYNRCRKYSKERGFKRPVHTFRYS